MGGSSGSSDLTDNGLGDGRPPIPTRPDAEGEREGYESEESGDEKPQVVVLREGKHLSEIDAENEKRKARGLPPLPDKNTLEEDPVASSNTASKDQSKTQKDDKPMGGLAFSSSRSAKPGAKKRKAGEASEGSLSAAATVPEAKKLKTKKAKKETKGLLSFGDGED